MTEAPPAPDRLAVVSDIHGNRWALDAVLADITARGITHVVNLGDCVYGPLDPAGTADVLVSLGWPTVRGNEDRLIVSAGDDSPTLRFVRQSLGREHLDWLEGLPLADAPYEGVFVCHGTPARDDEYLLHDVTPAGAIRRKSPDVATFLSGLSGRLVLCGHDHVPGSLSLSGGRRVVDPGSVGLQAYSDDSPHPHTMETGSPHARYTVLHRTATGWQEQRIAVPYDWERAAQAAARNGRDDWAAWLRAGIASTTENA